MYVNVSRKKRREREKEEKIRKGGEVKRERLRKKYKRIYNYVHGSLGECRSCVHSCEAFEPYNECGKHSHNAGT